MSRLDELIKELCPNGVEYKKLGELGTLYNGLTGKNKNDFIEGNQKYITYVNVFNNISIDIETQDKVKIDRNEKQNKVEYGDVIFTASSENIEDVGMTSVLTNLIEEDLYLNSFCFGFRFSTDIMLPSFSKYLFRSENLRKQIRKTANGVTRYNISKEKIKEILVPILPLKIQEEIVRILDDYTKSVEELKEKLNAELITRKKQYSWYRDYLLKFENKIKIVKLGELFEFKNGINKEKSSFGKGTPIINYVNVYKKNKIYFEDLQGLVEATDDELTRYKVKRGDVFFTRTSETIEEIGFTSVLLEDIENCVFSGFLLRARPLTDLLLPEYCAYCFSTSSIRNAIIRKSTYTTRALINGTSLSQIEIPLPPLEVQKRIVEVLDNFEKICNNLNIGLPAEIEARQKQYEFYRNFLLTFKIENCTLPKTRQDKTRQDIIKLFMYIFGYIELELGEILKIKNGSDYKKFNIGNIPVYGSGGIINYIDTYIYDKESVLIPRKGSIGNLFYLDKPFWTVDTIFYTVIDKDIIIPKYVYYYLSKVNLEKLNTAGGVPSLTQTVLNKILIPLPSLEEQQRIVNILDRFDKLCNDISEGLPAEIEARQKQYEYYREKLLTFKNIND